MNHLSNGAIAVGSPGSIARLVAAVVHELKIQRKAGWGRRVELVADEGHAHRKIKAFLRGENPGTYLRRGASAAMGITGRRITDTEIRDYVLRAIRGVSGWEEFSVMPLEPQWQWTPSGSEK